MNKLHLFARFAHGGANANISLVYFYNVLALSFKLQLNN